MPIIAILADYPELAQGVGELVAEQTGYEHIQAQRLIQDAAQKYNLTQEYLAKNIEARPGMLHRLSQNSRKSIAYLEAALAELLQQDNLVTSGYLGYPMLREISHALKVRIWAVPQKLIRLGDKVHLPKREWSKNILHRQESYRKWVSFVYGLDITDSSLYDMTLNIEQIKLEDAVGSILHAVQSERFQPMTYSMGCVRDQALSSQVKIYLMDVDPNAEVKSKDGTVYIFTKAFRINKEEQAKKLKEDLIRQDGIKQVEIYWEKGLFNSIACGH